MFLRTATTKSTKICCDPLQRLKQEIRTADAILIGASKLNHLLQNMETVKAGPLPKDMIETFEAAWQITKGDSPEYFTLYKGKGSVGGENK